MKKRNIILQAAVVAAFAAVSSSAFATVTLDPAAASVPAKYASELVTDGITLTNAANAIDLAFKPTWGVSAGNHLYVRIDLTNAKFKTALTNASFISSSGTQTVSLASGGSTGATYAIFDISDTAGVQLTDTLTLQPADLTMVSASSNIGATVKLYTDAAAASANSTAVVGSALSDNYVTKAAALTTTFTAATNTAAVANSFDSFLANSTTGTSAGTLIELGSVVTTINSVLKPSSGAAVVAADLATATDLVLTGDFSATGTTGAVFMDTAAACTTAVGANASPVVAGSALVLNTAKTTATATGYSTVSLTNATKYVCLQVDGATAVPAQSVTGSLAFTGQVTGATIPGATGAVGTILRDGATMVAPLAQIPAGWTSRLVLTNSGSVARDYTVRALDVGGVTATLSGAAASGSLAANSTTVVDLPTTMTTSNNRASLVVTVAAPQNTIDGLYQIVNGTTGSISNHVMSYK